MKKTYNENRGEHEESRRSFSIVGFELALLDRELSRSVATSRDNA